MGCQTWYIKGEDFQQWVVKIPHPTCESLYYNVNINEEFEEDNPLISFSIWIYYDNKNGKEILNFKSVYLTKKECKLLTKMFNEFYENNNTQAMVIPDKFDEILRHWIRISPEGNLLELSIYLGYKTDKREKILGDVPFLMKKEDFKKVIEILSNF